MLPYDKLFWARVDASGVCWEWKGYVSSDGYGCLFRRAVGSRKAHRYAWELLVGDIPEGLTIDHLCLNKRCVNPDHMELVSRAVNVSRARQRTHCKNGHQLSGSNLAAKVKDTGRRCLTCKAEQSRRYRARKH